MKKGLQTILCTVFLLFLIAGCENCRANRLKVLGGDPVDYRCEGGDLIVARYYTLSDSSLNFVKVQLPDSEEYTLPQTVSGSGARYTDEMLMIWWVKGDSVEIQLRDDNGDWQPAFENCCVAGNTD